MAFQIKRTGAAEYGRHIKALIAGDPGSGKTRGIRSWPNPFVISAEGGLMSVAADGLRFVEIDAIAQLAEILRSLKQKPEIREDMFDGPVDTVMLDTIDEIQRQLVRERLRTENKESMSQGDWGWMGDKLRAIVRGFRNLDMNVVITSHLKTITDEDTGKTTVKPQIQGAFGDEIPGTVDLALLLRASPVTRIEDGETVREIRRFYQTYPDAQHPWVKDRSGCLAQEMPLDFETEYQRFYKAIYGDLKIPETVTVQRAATAPAAPSQAAVEAAEATVEATEERTRSQPAQEAAGAATEADPDEAAAALAEATDGAVMTAEEAEKFEADHTPEPAAPALAAVPEPEKPKRGRPRKEDAVKSDDAPADSQLALGANAEAPALPPCKACGGDIESEDQEQLSMMRFREPLCKGCFKDKKKK